MLGTLSVLFYITVAVMMSLETSRLHLRQCYASQASFFHMSTFASSSCSSIILIGYIVRPL